MPTTELHQLGALLRRHAGGRLVHQQQLGRAGERDGELHALDIAVGQLAAGPIGVRAEPDALEQGHAPRRGRDRPHRATTRACDHCRLISAICTFSATVMDTNVCAIWKVRPTPRRQMRRGARPVMVWPRQENATAVGLQLAAQHVEDRGLAGAVRADDGQQPAGLDGERHVARGHHAAERFAQPLDAEQAHAGALSRADGSLRGRDRRSMTPPTMPRGKASTMAMMVSPSSRRQ